MFRRFREEFELGHRSRTLSIRRPDTIGPRIAAADHDDVLRLGGDGRLIAERLAADSAVLLREERHRKVDSFESPAGDGEVMARGRHFEIQVAPGAVSVLAPLTTGPGGLR